MRIFRSLRTAVLAAAVAAVPASAFAGVFVSVSIAPPALPVYAQPMCPAPGYMWTPGYWAYGPAGYYWVPGVWVQPPAVGVLWTPGYWGWGPGGYIWHRGYWGPHVGFYGGVNYGFGYGGIGFAGGAWRGGSFFYNTAVVNVNRTVIRNVYVDRTVIRNNTYVNNRVSYNGGKGGIRATASPAEMQAARQARFQPTSTQVAHRNEAAGNRSQLYSQNRGRPPVAARSTVNQRAMNQRPANMGRSVQQTRAANNRRPQEQHNTNQRQANASRQGGEKHNDHQGGRPHR